MEKVISDEYMLAGGMVALPKPSRKSKGKKKGGGRRRRRKEKEEKEEEENHQVANVE